MSSIWSTKQTSPMSPTWGVRLFGMLLYTTQSVLWLSSDLISEEPMSSRKPTQENKRSNRKQGLSLLFPFSILCPSTVWLPIVCRNTGNKPPPSFLAWLWEGFPGLPSHWKTCSSLAEAFLSRSTHPYLCLVRNSRHHTIVYMYLHSYPPSYIHTTSAFADMHHPQPHSNAPLQKILLRVYLDMNSSIPIKSLH